MSHNDFVTELTLFISEILGVNSGEILRGGGFMKNIVFILLSFCLAGDMEVDGGLTVTEGVTAASFAGNGGGLSGIGIKPDRIYHFYHNYILRIIKQISLRFED